MATHSSVLAWRIPGTGEPGGLPSMGSHRVGHDWSDLAAAAAAAVGGGGGLVSKSCLTLVIPWTVAYQAPLSMGCSKQEYWSGLPFPSPKDVPDPGIEPGSPALQGDSLLSEPPKCHTLNCKKLPLIFAGVRVLYIYIFFKSSLRDSRWSKMKWRLQDEGSLRKE